MSNKKTDTKASKSTASRAAKRAASKPQATDNTNRRGAGRRSEDHVAKQAPKQASKQASKNASNKPRKKDFGRKTRERRQKAKDRLKDPVELDLYFDTLRQTRKIVLRYLLDHMTQYHVTPRITKEKATEDLGLSVSAWESTIKRMYLDGVLEKRSFKGGAPGLVFWFEPRIKDAVVKFCG